MSSTPAHALDLWPFQSEDEKLLEDVRAARIAGRLELADALLAKLAGLRPEDPEVGLEQGRIAVARQDFDMAAAILEEVAQEAPLTTAREELAAVYVALGRWPDAVSALNLAFEERGTGLPVKAVLADPRFGDLVGFAPFDKLVAKVRENQAGPLGRMMLRLERLENTVQETVIALEQLGELLTLVARVFTSFLFPFISFVLLGLLSTAGVSQLSPLGRPWTLLTGFAAATAVWASGTHQLTGGSSWGFETIGLGTSVVLGAWGLLALLGIALREIRNRYRVDPWGDRQRDLTLALIEEVEHLADAFERGEVLEADLRQSTRRLVTRLSGRARRLAPRALEPSGGASTEVGLGLGPHDDGNATR